MTPALRESATKARGVHLSSLSTKTMEPSALLKTASPRAVEEMPKKDCSSQINCSVFRFPTPEPRVNNHLVNLKPFGSLQPSNQYQTTLLMSSPSSLKTYDNNSVQRKLGEPYCSGLKNGTGPQFRRIGHSQSEELIDKGPKSDVPTRCHRVIEVKRALVSNATKVNSGDKTQPRNCKWCPSNGFLSKTSNAKIQRNILHCPQKKVWPGHPDSIMSSLATRKEKEVNARLVQCVKKQKVLLSQAQRTQKHLQMLLAKHVVKHCGQQLRCCVKHQLQKLKASGEPSGAWDLSFPGCTEVNSAASLSTVENGSWRDPKTGFARSAASKFQRFVLSAAGLLSHVEENLDSEATGSSSDEEWNEKPVNKNAAANCSSEWRWLVDRARIGSRWAWLQAQISELECKIQQLTGIHRQIRANKGMVILEECKLPKHNSMKQIQLTDQAALLSPMRNSQIPMERPESLLEQDFELSPSSPTLLLQNIERQSAQLTEIISSLIAPFSQSPTSSPLSSKSYRHKHLTNGISCSFSENVGQRPPSSSWLRSEKQVKKRGKDRTRTKSPSTITTCTSARTRPLQSFHKRKLYRLNPSPACCLSQQALPSKDVLNHLSVHMPCMMPTSTWSACDHTAKPGLSSHRVHELDASFHPVLSLPTDVPLHLYFETMVKGNEMKRDSSETAFLEREVHFTHHTTPEEWRNGHSPICKSQTKSETTAQLLEEGKKQHLSETSPGTGEKNRFEEFTLQNADPGALHHFTAVSDVQVLSRSIPTTPQSARRRIRSESSYDIDNIVIPMSLVAPAKLEKLQYKEILTPSWRIVDLQPSEPLEKPSLGEEEREDLSDEVFSLRHKHYEEKEQTRWSLWEQSKWQKRINRSLGKNPDGQESQVSVLKENSNICTVPCCAAETTPDQPSEVHNYLCVDVSPILDENQEAKSGWWERRVFPLKNEEIAALLCQDETADQPERSAMTLHGDDLCAQVASGSTCQESNSREDWKVTSLMVQDSVV
ncbi:KAT8 regulatory NSL complex subunit 1-like protein isoform X2 [Tachyglossus aculeatus]|uniref:KAT8 regulatory NSL complex subunit 1-like protein isoform X2 n=1 Tax=Tachyglossus aculeatus TaxID=9261 RepID=UPI0018F79525|nr:KAT8 regulatory NSL complex subunit 1-like protein isoform X2 [Tachyglossus aculeatus]